MLTERQKDILRTVVEAHLEDGRPVGSKAIAEQLADHWSPSTIRNELAVLEREGFLTHPHTSAGRVPTEAGYRFHAESLLEDAERLPAPIRRSELELSALRREVDDAMRQATATLSRVTDLAALATLPPVHAATIHRVEALPLGPQSVIVIVITSTGGVVKRVFDFSREIDRGLVEWASAYLNERLAGMGLGARMLAGRLTDPGLDAREQEFVKRLSPVFLELEGAAESSVYLDGAARLLTEERAAELPRIDELMRALERRASLLAMLSSVLDRNSVYMWIGGENPHPELRSVSVIGANYGLGYRNLGAVGVIGPLRMDYARAITSVREAAAALSGYFESVYEG